MQYSSSKQPRGRSRFVGNTMALGVATAAAAILTLTQTKILTLHLPLATFGSFVALRGLSLLYSMVAANGLPQMLVRFLPHHESHGQHHAAVRLSLFSLVVTAAAVGLIAACCELLGWFDYTRVREVAGLSFWFLVTTLGVALKLTLYGGFNGLRRLPAQMLLETVSLAVQVAWIFLVRERLTVALLFQIIGTVSIATVIVGVPWFFRRLGRDISSHVETDDTRVSYSGYWFFASLLSLAALAFTDVDRYVLASALTLELVGLFHVASRLLKLSNRFLSAGVLAFQPEVSRLTAETRTTEVAATTGTFLRLNVYLSTLFALAVILFAPELVNLVATSDYLGALSVLALLMASVPLTAATAPLTAVMKARDRVRLALVADLVWAVAFVIGLLVFCRWQGLVGAGYAQLVACGFQLLVAMGMSTTVIPAGNIVGCLSRVAFAVALALVPFAALALFAGEIFPPWWQRAIGLVLTVILVRFTSRWFGVLSSGDVARVRASTKSTLAHRLLRLAVSE